MPEETVDIEVGLGQLKIDDDKADADPKKPKRRNRRGRKGKGKKGTVDADNVNANDRGDRNDQAGGGGGDSKQKNTDQNKGRKKRNGRRRGRDRYFGRFRCRVCRRMWDSAFVYTIGGTKSVLFKQRCKNCNDNDAWMFPYALEILLCSVCQSEVCDCVCEDCGELRHQRYKYNKTVDKNGDEIEEREDDDSYEYCKCDHNKRRTKQWVGGNISEKPHMRELCEKCQKGFPCGRLQNETAFDSLEANES